MASSSPRSSRWKRLRFLFTALTLLAFFCLMPRRGQSQVPDRGAGAPEPGSAPTPPAPAAATPAPASSPGAHGADDDNHVTADGIRGECHGPAECCITDPARTTVPLPAHVRVGLRVLSITDINERNGTFTMDAYVMSRWPAGSLFPDMKIRNLAEEATVVDERFFSEGGMCYRARRFQNNFRTWFRLRRFPFDDQQLTLRLEDNLHTAEQVIFDAQPWPVNYSADAYRALPDWEFMGYPTIRQRPANFVFAPGGRPARLVMLEVPIHRLWSFYLTRYFIPMFLIVVLAYSLFWIRPDDVGASSGMGMTCVLAIIAFQLTQSDSLPRVPYMTLADRVYSACYVATTVALLLSIAASYLDYKGRTESGERLLRVARRLYPVLFALGSLLAFYTGWTAQGTGDQDQNRPLAPPRPPAGEVYWSPTDSRPVAGARTVTAPQALLVVPRGAPAPQPAAPVVPPSSQR